MQELVSEPECRAHLNDASALADEGSPFLAPSWSQLADAVRGLTAHDTGKFARAPAVRLWTSFRSLVTAAERDGHFLLSVVPVLVQTVADEVLHASPSRSGPERREALGEAALGILRALLTVPIYVQSLTADQLQPVLQFCQEECLQWFQAQTAGSASSSSSSSSSSASHHGLLVQQNKTSLSMIWTSILLAQPSLMNEAIVFMRRMLTMCVHLKQSSVFTFLFI